MRKTTYTFAAAAAISAGVLQGAPAVAAGHEEFRATATLSWKNEDTGSDRGFGFAAVRISGERVCFGVRWNNIPTPVAAHIHAGEAGVSGPVVVPLFEAPGPNAGKNTAWGCITAAAEVTEAITMSPHDYYVNVHTEDFPGGAIRGQLMHH